MRFSSTAAALAACCASAHAFSDTSPFIMWSTAKLEKPSTSDQIQSKGEVHTSVEKLLADCPTERYLIVSQPNVHAGDLLPNGVSPNLHRSARKAEFMYTVAEVAGQLDVKTISTYIRRTCEKPFIDELDLTALSSDNGAETLKKNDEELGMVLEQYEREGSYTVIYAGIQRETHKTYQADFQDFQENVNTELKRSLRGFQQRADNSTRNLPLFEKYQYFSPGIFMGLVSLVVLMSILYAGISAVASLEVPYGAFDKEMGPAAQKKQQ
ncbi:BIG1-domain-containing protein [Hypoxylon sp. FL1150]|nr:BIG1-domain-containing protein [Hypoxylon sp. FL1150]